MIRKYNFEKQHSKKLLHAIERIEKLLDEDSFVEVDSGEVGIIRDKGTDKIIPYDGVITGYGTIFGKKVCVYAQDITVAGGTVGKIHGKKIENIMDMAIRSGCPVIAINDSGGARIQESVDAITAYGNIFYKNTEASGIIPQIAIIAGTCAGGAAYSPGLQDFIFVIEKQSKMFLTGPKVIEKVTGEKVSSESLGGSKVHSSVSGVAHYRSSSEDQCFKDVRKLVSMLPSSCNDKGESVVTVSKPQKKFPLLRFEQNRKIEDILPKNKKEVFDVRKIIEYLSDKDSVFEIQKEFAENIVVAFAKISGMLVGFVANNSIVNAGALDTDASDKAARFIRYCDAYNIPIITLADTPGFIPGTKEEYKGVIRHGAKMIYAYSEATISKIAIIIRKVYGGACLAMGCKSLGADFCYGWPDSEISIIGAESAVPIIYKNRLNENTKEELLNDYFNEYVNAEKALEKGYLDCIIEPNETRKRLISDLVLLANNNRKTKMNIKKHGCMPL